MSTIVKPITRKTAAPVAGSRGAASRAAAGRSAAERPVALTPRRQLPVTRDVIDLTAADRPLTPAMSPPTAEAVSAEANAVTDNSGLRPVLSVAEAAQLLGVSEWLVLQQIRLGELPHKRCGRRIVLSRDRLLAWLNDE